jgi:Arc/MetJ-type ribon-helix-helix transcriptional regulator
MTVHLDLPANLEQRLLAEVQSGRHASLEEAILEKLSRNEDIDLLSVVGTDAAHIRRDLDNAWNDRSASADGEEFFALMAAKSAAHQSHKK